MGEIATRGMIRAKISSFPTGNDNECLTKSEIIGTRVAIVDGNFSEYECVDIESIASAKQTVVVNINIGSNRQMIIAQASREPLSTLSIKVQYRNTSGYLKDVKLTISMYSPLSAIAYLQDKAAIIMGASVSPSEDNTYRYVAKF